MGRADEIPGLVPQPGNIVLGQAAGRQRACSDDAHRAAVDGGASRRPDPAGAFDGNWHDRYLAGDGDDEGAVLELADGTIRRDPPLREGQSERPAARWRAAAWSIRRTSGDSRSTSIIPIVRSAGPSSGIRNSSRMARTRSDNGSVRRCTIGSRLDWWLDTITQGAAGVRCPRPSTVTRAPAARSHTAAHHRSIRSVRGESARAAPRHRTSSAASAVASTPAANVGTVRQDTDPPFRLTCPDGRGARLIRPGMVLTSSSPGNGPAWPAARALGPARSRRAGGSAAAPPA